MITEVTSHFSNVTTDSWSGLLVDYCAEKKIPLFGVCLGHQAIGEAFGATVSRAPELLHGKTSQVIHQRTGVFANLPSPFTATRYHSLAIERHTVPDELEIIGQTELNVVMAIQHKTLPISGVQFHPEFKSTPWDGHPLFNAYIKATLDHQSQRTNLKAVA